MQPGRQGSRALLNAAPSLDAALASALAAGLVIDTPRIDLLQGMGAFAVIIDTEGKLVGLHTEL